MKSLLITVPMTVAINLFALDNKKKDVYPRKGSYRYINNMRLDSLDTRYVQIELKQVTFKGKVKVEFSFGQEYAYDSEAFIKNENQLVYQFTGLIDVLNFLDFNSWIYLDMITKSEYQIILLKKKYRIIIILPIF